MKKRVVKTAAGDDVDIYKRFLGVGEIDFSNMIIGGYLVIEPISIEYLYNLIYGTLTKGWLCQKDNNYFALPTRSLSKMYSSENPVVSYFGVKLTNEDLAFKSFNKEDFLKLYQNECKNHQLEACSSSFEPIDSVAKNIDINITFFESLKEDLFENAIKGIVGKYKFKEVNDLSGFKNCLYIMVLDKYKQFYVGKSEKNLKTRIKRHWKDGPVIGRHFWYGQNLSKLKVDCFRPFDTTRIFVLTDIDTLLEENHDEANDRRLECTGTFGISYYDAMNDLEKAERIVINNCPCKYCLSDRPPIISPALYEKVFSRYGCSEETVLIKHYNFLDQHSPKVIRKSDKWLINYLKTHNH